MIKELKSKIFLLMMISLSIVSIGILILYTFYNYRNTINTSTFFLERVYGEEKNQLPDQAPKNDSNISGSANNSTSYEQNTDNAISNTENTSNSNYALNTENTGNSTYVANTESNENTIPDVPNLANDTDTNNNSDINIEGFYFVRLDGDEITNSSDENLTEEIKKFALEASKRKNQRGIIGSYVYNVRKDRNGQVSVMLVENNEAISRIRILFITSILIGIAVLGLIYAISKKTSDAIVKPVEETLEKQTQFISDASHELKTPLAVISANADVLEAEVGQNKWLTYIQNEIESMNKLINELLLLAKIGNTDSIVEPEKINLSSQVEMISSMFESMAYEKNVKINTDIEQKIFLNGRKEDVEHILSTLIDNAIKHTDSGNQIWVELKKEKDNIFIKVKNQGKEIPKDEREKIFERFYRVDKSRNRNEKRYGLGLAIAKSTVEKYKGSIEVDCKDGITIFTAKIPT